MIFKLRTYKYLPFNRYQLHVFTLSISCAQASIQQSISPVNVSIGLNHPGSLSGVVGGPPSASNVIGSVGSSHTQHEKYDGWEFPRHRLKFFNILGEGAFGQVWRCEATDIDGKYIK